MSEQLSLAPPVPSRKGPVFYHFSYRDNQPERRGFTRQDSLNAALGRIFETDFRDQPRDVRDRVISIILNEFEVEHKNLVMLIAATLSAYYMKSHNYLWSPEAFRHYWNIMAGVVMKETSKTAGKGDPRINTAKFEATFFRYLTYVLNNSRELTPVGST
jgi:hypothetical protein